MSTTKRVTKPSMRIAIRHNLLTSYSFCNFCHKDKQLQEYIINSCRSVALWVYLPSHVTSLNEVTESDWTSPFLSVVSFTVSLEYYLKSSSLLLDYPTIILSNEKKKTKLVHLVYKRLLSFRLWCIEFSTHLLLSSYNRFRTISCQKSIVTVPTRLRRIIFGRLPTT